MICIADQPRPRPQTVKFKGLVELEDLRVAIGNLPTSQALVATKNLSMLLSIGWVVIGGKE